MKTKTAKIQAFGSYVRVYDDSIFPPEELFTVSVSGRLVERVQERAAKRGYSVPQIYPGKDGILRIWF